MGRACRRGCFAPLAAATRISSAGSPRLHEADVRRHHSLAPILWVKATRLSRAMEPLKLLLRMARQNKLRKLQNQLQSRSQFKRSPRRRSLRSASNRNQSELNRQSACACLQVASPRGSGKNGRLFETLATC